MTSKERAYLKSLASTIDPIMQIGKSCVTPELTQAVGEALDARELIKLHVLKNCVDDATAMAQMLAERNNAEVVQVIGSKVVLYKQNKKKPKILLPGMKAPKKEVPSTHTKAPNRK